MDDRPHPGGGPAGGDAQLGRGGAAPAAGGVAFDGGDAQGVHAGGLGVQGGAAGDAPEQVGDQLRLGHVQAGHRAGAGDQPAVGVEVVAEGDGAAGVAAVPGHTHPAEGGALRDRLALQLGDAAEELEQEPADGGGGVEWLGGGTDGDAQAVQGVVGGEQGAQAAAQAVEAVHQHDAEVAGARIGQQPLPRGPVGEGHGAADAVVGVHRGDGQAVQVTVAVEEVPLARDRLPLRLLIGAHPAVEGDARREVGASVGAGAWGGAGVVGGVGWR